MRLLRALACVVALVVWPASASSAPILIDFESLRHDDALASDVGSAYIENAFRFEARHHEPGNPLVLRTLGTQHSGFSDSTSLFQGVSLGEIVLTEVRGRPFDLLSISFAEVPNFAPGGQEPVNGGPFDIAVYGTRVDGTSVTNIVHVTSFLSLEPFFFTAFTHLASVRWFQGAGASGGSPTHQFDDVRAAPVPEPGTLALLSVAAVGLARRRSVRFGKTRLSKNLTGRPFPCGCC